MKKKCEFCKKKELLGFSCRCKKIFCCRHRLPHEHNCSFDFKTLKQKQLHKENPKLVPIKVDRI